MSSGLYDLSAKDFDKTLDLTKLKPYGDTMNDGKVQVSFTLPVPNNDRGMEAARALSRQMGLSEPNVACARSLDRDFTFYVVYGSCTHTVDYTKIKVQAIEDESMDMDEVDAYIRENIGRKIVVLGASTGTDAHTVGIDAIMNRKGFAGHYGLERYEMIEALNMGSQVPNEEFLAKAEEEHSLYMSTFNDFCSLATRQLDIMHTIASKAHTMSGNPTAFLESVRSIISADSDPVWVRLRVLADRKHPGVMAKVMSAHPQLTKREQLLIIYLLLDFKSEAIATAMGWSNSEMVSRHKYNLSRKMQLNTSLTKYLNSMRNRAE